MCSDVTVHFLGESGSDNKATFLEKREGSDKNGAKENVGTGKDKRGQGGGGGGEGGGG